MHNKLERMKETLMSAVEVQMCNLEEADTKELGEVIDMIKDLEEAIYYCTVTEAMKHSDSEMEIEWGNKEHHKEDKMYYNDSNKNYMYRMPYYADNDRMYARRRRADGTFYMDSENVSNQNDMDEEYMDRQHQNMRDSREGRSYNSRRMYMESKEMKKDKATQLRELEKYMQELSQDIVEMINDSSPEEKQYLEKKISALASKVGQMK